MRICKIWDADYPWDIRVEKISNTLVEAGHSVHLVCRNARRARRTESNGRFTIHRLPSLTPKFGRLNGVLNFPFPFNPVWIQAIDRVVRQTCADLLLVRDLPLALPALAIGKTRKIPVVLDMAENYPAMLRDKLAYTPTTGLVRLVCHPMLARMAERLCIRAADHIIVVVEESRDRLLREGVGPNRVTVVCNTPLLDRWAAARERLPREGEQDGIALVYLGNLDGSRGVDVAIRATRLLKDQGRLVRMLVVGEGPNRQQLLDVSASLGVADRVSIMGRLPFDRVQATMAAAHVGVIPHYVTVAWNTTIPNKLFDYMLLGLPVIASEAAPTARIIRAEDCGEVYPDRDPSGLAGCVRALEDPGLRKAKGARGRAAVLRRYNWAHDSRTLLRIIEGVKGVTP